MTPPPRPPRAFHPATLLANPAAGGLLLMGIAVLALLVANSPWRDAYVDALGRTLGPMSVLHWINDGLMALFFLLVGLEIKREALVGALATWPARVLPGAAAAGGMLLPALVFVAFNAGDPAALRGWAIPTATDIAFALGVVALLGRRVPPSLKIFLTALAIIDDLGAVLIIAFFYTAQLALPWLGAAAGVLAALWALNRAGVRRLAPYLVLGALLWFVVLRSGVHATLAGVALALAIPLRVPPGTGEPPLERLEHALQPAVNFGVVPLFGFANAGLSFAGMGLAALTAPLTLGVAGGLLAGKVAGVLGVTAGLVGLGLAPMPAGARWPHLLGVALLCGIGFTMSLFIGGLAFAGDAHLQDEVKAGILAGSLLAGLAGAVVLRTTRPN